MSQTVPQDGPQSYVNPTRLGRPLRGATVHAAAAPAASAAVPTTATAEQEAKRIEKIRAHSSSHHTAGTVTLDT